jgi:hypothetical protein
MRLLNSTGSRITAGLALVALLLIAGCAGKDPVAPTREPDNGATKPAPGTNLPTQREIIYVLGIDGID